jgi:hypothetical protein
MNQMQSTVRLFFAVILLAFVVIAFQSCSRANYSSSRLSRKLILRDEGLSKLSFVDLANPQKNWYVSIPAGRDLQLVGNGRVLIGTGNGYEERNISDGTKAFEISTFKGTQTVRRLRNGNTLLSGVNWQDEKGIVLVEIDNAGKVVRKTAYPGFSYVRCIRETVNGTYLVTSNNIVFEGDTAGKILWRATVEGNPEKTHIWQAVRLGNGNTIVATGYSKNFQIFDKEGKPAGVINGPADVNPNFFAGFQVLKNGNYVVANWQGHGPKLGSSGKQVLEFSSKGDLVWAWTQDPEKFSSIQGVLVLDGLNINRLHVENEKGILIPIDIRK